MSESLRPLSPRERDVIVRLIDLAPPERQAALRDSAARTQAGKPCSCGCGSFDLVVDGSSQTGQHFLVAEGFVDRPGKPTLGVMLFAIDDVLDFLELYDPARLDGDPIIELPSPADIYA